MTSIMFAWLPYFILGLIGIVFHAWTKPKKEGESIWHCILSSDTVMSLLAFGVLIFFWVDSGVEFLGMQKNAPNGLTFFCGYFSQSLLGHLTKQFESKFKTSEN